MRAVKSEDKRNGLFGKLEIEKLSELFFGSAKHPLNYGLGLNVGNGEVIPEVKFFPRV
ncbi:MAG: methyltransferase MtaB domain-containing protein [Thermoproteota archaeon]